MKKYFILLSLSYACNSKIIESKYFSAQFCQTGIHKILWDEKLIPNQLLLLDEKYVALINKGFIPPTIQKTSIDPYHQSVSKIPILIRELGIHPLVKDGKTSAQAIYPWKGSPYSGVALLVDRDFKNLRNNPHGLNFPVNRRKLIFVDHLNTFLKSLFTHELFHLFQWRALASGIYDHPFIEGGAVAFELEQNETSIYKSYYIQKSHFYFSNNIKFDHYTYGLYLWFLNKKFNYNDHYKWAREKSTFNSKSTKRPNWQSFKNYILTNH
jgi:hypothetical protein